MSKRENNDFNKICEIIRSALYVCIVKQERKLSEIYI